MPTEGTNLEALLYRLRGMYSIVYDTTIYDRNTVDMKRVLYGPFTIVIITITVGYVNVNDCILSFTIVVSIDLGNLEINLHHGI
jgi:hypothetical protein